VKYEEHEKLSKWLQTFFEDARTCFDILKSEYGNKHPRVKNTAKVINLMANLTIPLKDSSEIDRVREGISIMDKEECRKWRKLYDEINTFITEGYYR